MACYRNGICGPFQNWSCNQCPASKSSYLQNRSAKKENELSIKGCNLSFKTRYGTYEEAWEELKKICESAGISICGGYEGVLKDKKGVEID